MVYLRRGSERCIWDKLYKFIELDRLSCSVNDESAINIGDMLVQYLSLAVTAGAQA